MRRKDREITDLTQLIEIMQSCDVCRIAFFDKEYPYILPMNFGLNHEGTNISLYFHCAGEGKKLSLLAENSKVGFEMDCSHQLIKGEKACDYTMEFESVIGQGTIEIVAEEEKRAALDFIMRNYSKETEFHYEEKYVKAVTLLKLSVINVTGKRLKK